jgi:hypothetical protein
MEQNPSSEPDIHSTSQEISKIYGTQTCSQDPDTGPYPKRDESNPQLSTLFS